MPRLSWNEIETRAEQFAARWEGETYEKGESQSFWSEFLTIFGIDRRRHGAFFEYAIKKAGGGQGFIDLFCPGKLLAHLRVPLAVPKELVDAHQELDRAVDRLYQRAAFGSDPERVALLFTQYQELASEGSSARYKETKE